MSPFVACSNKIVTHIVHVIHVQQIRSCISNVKRNAPKSPRCLRYIGDLIACHIFTVQLA